MKKIITIFCICILSVTTVNAQRITLKIASVAPARSPWDTEQKRLAQEWARITDGKVSINFYDAAAQGGETGVIRKMRSVRPGQKSPIDGAVFTSIGIYELSPQSKVMTLCVPFLFQNQDELDAVLDEFSDEMKKSITDQGYVLLGWFNVGWAYFLTREEARTPEELKSLKLTVGGFDSPELGAAFAASGFTTEDVSSDKILQSIRSPSGVEGLYTIPMYAYAARYYEGLPYVLDLPICPVMTAFVISQSAWNQIPDEYKADLMAAVKESESKFISVQKEADEENLALMEKAGAVRVKLTPEEVKLWQDTLRADAAKMATVKNSIIDIDFYNRITTFLAEYRAGNN